MIVKAAFLEFALVFLVGGGDLGAADLPRGEVPGACKVDDAAFHTEEGGCLQFAGGLVWGLAPVAKREYARAEAYCTGLTEAERGNWRLPTASELQAVAANRQAMLHFEFRTADFFWGKSSGTGTDAWTVELGSGEKVQAEKETAAGRVVCVRAPEDIDRDGVPDSSDSCNTTPRNATVATTGNQKGCAGDSDRVVTAEAVRTLATFGCKVETEYFKTGQAGCVYLRTGLEWSRVSPNPQRRKYANRYCDTLVEGISSQVQDWRLPTKNELHGIAGAELAGRHFKFNVHQSFWTSTIGTRSGRFFSIRPYNRYIPFEESPQVVVNLSNGEVAGIATQAMAVFGDTYLNNYSERLVPANEDHPAPVICVRASN